MYQNKKIKKQIFIADKQPFSSLKPSHGGWDNFHNDEEDYRSLYRRLETNLNRYEKENRKGEEYERGKLPSLQKTISNKKIKVWRKKEVRDDDDMEIICLRMKTVNLMENLPSEKKKSLNFIGKSRQKKQKYRSKVIAKVERVKEIQTSFRQFSDHQFSKFKTENYKSKRL